MKCKTSTNQNYEPYPSVAFGIYAGSPLYLRFFFEKADETRLDIDDFIRGEEIDLEHEIPEGENPLNDAHERGKEFQGDLVLTEEQVATFKSGNAIALLEMRQVILKNHWPRKGDHIMIPYTINATQFSSKERANIARAFEEFEKHTCFRYSASNNC